MQQVIIFLMIISLILLIVCFILWFWFWYTQIRDSLRPDRIVYLSSPIRSIKNHLTRILTTYDLQENEILEFGSGTGNAARMLASLSDSNIKAYEINTLLNIIHALVNKVKKVTNISIIKGDIFNLEPKNACIYCFLSTTMLTLLYRKGVFKSNFVICLKFNIEGLEPTQVIPIEGSHSQLSIYDFR